MTETGPDRICTWCGATVGFRQACASCTEGMSKRQDVNTMTPDERADEMQSLIGVLEVPFDMLHKRITELVGRNVWTHELADPHSLVREIREQKPASIGDVVNKAQELMGDKPVIVAVISENGHSRE